MDHGHLLAAGLATAGARGSPGDLAASRDLLGLAEAAEAAVADFCGGEGAAQWGAAVYGFPCHEGTLQRILTCHIKHPHTAGGS